MCGPGFEPVKNGGGRVFFSLYSFYVMYGPGSSRILFVYNFLTYVTTHTHTRAHAHARTHTHTHTHAHAHTHMHTHTHTHTHTMYCTCTTAWYRSRGLLLQGGKARQNNPTGNYTGCGAASQSYPVWPGTYGRKKYSPTHGLATPQWVGRMGCSPEWQHWASVQDSRLHYPHPLWDTHTCARTHNKALRPEVCSLQPPHSSLTRLYLNQKTTQSKLDLKQHWVLCHRQLWRAVVCIEAFCCPSRWWKLQPQLQQSRSAPLTYLARTKTTARKSPETRRQKKVQ